MPLTEGRAFAGYTIGRVLGTGGMGEVYLARHPRLPRDDALKVLGTAVSSDDEYRRRFNLEAEMVAGLHHPHIVTIYDRGECDGQLWIAMEFVNGTDAGRLLSERHPTGVPPRELVRIVTAVASALDFAHSRHVLHRDIKPANILLGLADTGDHRVLLADFGVARWTDKPNNLTGIDMTVGTVAYAAPEQLKGEEIDGRADQYALAATAYHLLTGAPPFSQTNPAIVISHHLTAPPPEIDRPDLARFGPVFARALAKDPRERFARCTDFAAALQQALVAGADPAGHRRAAPTVRRRRMVAVLGALAVAGAAAAAVAVVAGHRGPSPDAPTASPPAVSGRMDLPVVVIGADCAVLGAAAVTETGEPAYCARADPANPGPVWTIEPQRLRGATPSP